MASGFNFGETREKVCKTCDSEYYKKVNQGCESTFYKIGVWSAVYAPAVLVFFVVLFGGLGLGIFQAVFRNDLYYLWIEQGSRLLGERAYIQEHHAAGLSRTEFQVYTNPDYKSNGITKANMPYIYDNLFATLQVNATDEDLGVVGWHDICDRYPTPPPLYGLFRATGGKGLPCNKYTPTDCFTEGAYGSYGFDIPAGVTSFSSTFPATPLTGCCYSATGTIGVLSVTNSTTPFVQTNIVNCQRACQANIPCVAYQVNAALPNMPCTQFTATALYPYSNNFAFDVRTVSGNTSASVCGPFGPYTVCFPKSAPMRSKYIWQSSYKNLTDAQIKHVAGTAQACADWSGKQLPTNFYFGGITADPTTKVATSIISSEILIRIKSPPIFAQQKCTDKCMAASGCVQAMQVALLDLGADPTTKPGINGSCQKVLVAQGAVCGAGCLNTSLNYGTLPGNINWTAIQLLTDMGTRYGPTCMKALVNCTPADTPLCGACTAGAPPQLAPYCPGGFPAGVGTCAAIIGSQFLPTPALTACVTMCAAPTAGTCVQGALGKSMLCEQSCIKNCSNPSDEDIAVAESTILAWELAFINKMAAINKNTSIPYEVDYFSERSTDDLVSAAGAADGKLIVIGYICMVVFGCITLFNMDLLQSRVTLGFGGMILVILSIVAAMGFSAAVGIFYVPTIVQVLPFLALGLGTYDMFVMAFTFNYVPDKTVPAMIGDLLKECGPRLLLTCTTNIIVFGIGTNIPLPAVSLFAGAMCIVILFNFLILVIGFSALIALNAERMRQNKLDCCCCIHAAYKSSAISTERAHQIGWCPTNFAKLMFHPISQIFVFVATVVIFAVGMWGIPQVQIGLPLQDIVPKDFYAYGFLKARTNFYNSGTSFLVTGYRAGKSYQIDHKSPKFHADVLNLEAQLQALPGSDSSFPVWSVSWIDTFLYWAATSYQTASGSPGDSAGCTRVGTSNDPLINVLGLSPTGKPQVLSSLSSRLITIPQNWTRCFSTFLGSSGIGSVQYLEMDDNYEILSSRIPWFQTKLDTDQKIVDYIVASRALTDASPQPVFPSGNYYDLYEQYVRTREYLGSNLGFTAIGVILIIWCFLFHPGAVLIMFAVIVITVAEIVGFLAFFNLKLNGVSVVNIISGIGVINPPIAHITRVFLVTPGTNAYRAEHALAALTFPMLFSTISTFVGEFPMEFARFPYFTLYFFYMYVLIGILTIINAFLPLPLILAYLGPGYFGDENSPTGNPDKPQPYEKGGLVEIPGLEDSNAPTSRTS